jgi:thiamine biosynthesis lipoprotein
MVIPALFVGALFLVTFLRQPNGPVVPDQWLLESTPMGTTMMVKIVVPEEGAPDRNETAELIRRVVDEVDERMSNYRPDSELSRLNRHGVGPFEASSELLEVISEARRISQLSGGAFDITVGPLVDAWGFGPEARHEPPDDATIGHLLEIHGWDGLVIDARARTVSKTNPEMRCDLSAIAKGYAVDRVHRALTDLGLVDFMVEIGGEVRTAGRNAEGSVWRIGVERPQSGQRGIWSAVELEDLAMATSGDYRNYYEVDGVRLSHMIDPRTGRPITHNLASASVIHPSCMTADALATALSVLGPEEGKALVEREGLAALFLIRNAAGGFDEWTSEGWPDGNSAAAGDVVFPEDV